jgi:hypothetical protein
MEDTMTQNRKKEIFTIMVATVVWTILVIYGDEALGGQDLFLLGYGGGVVYIIMRSRSFDFKYNTARTLVLLETSLLFYGGGFAAWLIDRNFCSTVRSMHLHAFWHFGAGFGTYTSVVFWIWARNEFLQRKQRLQGITPMDRWIESDLIKVL